MTSANMIGVRSGTSSSRGVRAVSCSRRRESVASGLRARAVIGSSPSLSGGFGEPAARESQIDVVERRLPGAHRGGEAELVDGGDRLATRVAVERNGEARADGEGVVAGDAARAERGERPRRGGGDRALRAA